MMDNCTTEDIPVEDLAKPCRLLTKELRFQHQLTKKDKKRILDLDSIVKSRNVAIELQIKEF